MPLENGLRSFYSKTDYCLVLSKSKGGSSAWLVPGQRRCVGLLGAAAAALHIPGNHPVQGDKAAWFTTLGGFSSGHLHRLSVHTVSEY